jgi:hypothetical protein
MKRWTMRILGTLNVLFGLVGLWFFIIRLTWHFEKAPVVYSARDWAIFSLLSFCTVSMVTLLAYLGIKLIIGKKTDLRLMVFLFAAEILYFWVNATIFVLIYPSVTNIEIGFWQLAVSPIAPQIVIWYPLLGIIICVALFLRGDFVAQKGLP